MKKPMVLLVIAWMVFTCNKPEKERLLGKWKLDSAQYHYNNFFHSSTGWYQEEIYEYLPTDEVIVSAVNAYLKIPYLYKDKEIHYLKANGETEEIYEIIKLDQRELVLKVENTPLFQGKNQTRYEIRYFSKID